MTSLAYALEPSSCAASATGPNATTPAAWQRSTKPATSGTSGPITTRSIPAAAIFAGSSAPSNGAASRAIPAFPGRAEHFRRLRRAQQRAHDRVLAPTTADHENSAQRAAMKSSIGIAIKVS